MISNSGALDLLSNKRSRYSVVNSGNQVFTKVFNYENNINSAHPNNQIALPYSTPTTATITSCNNLNSTRIEKDNQLNSNNSNGSTSTNSNNKSSTDSSGLIQLSNVCSLLHNNINSNLNNLNGNLNNLGRNVTIYNDITKLQHKFGKYGVYNKQNIDGEDWINSFIYYLKTNYLYPDKITSYFSIFLSDEFRDWFNKLEISVLENIDLFSESFIKENIRLVYKYHDFCNYQFSEFIRHLEIEFTKLDNNKKQLESLKNRKIYTYIKYKIIFLEKCFPNITKSDLIKRIIFSIDDINLKNKFYNYRSVIDLNIFLDFAKILDSQNI